MKNKRMTDEEFQSLITVDDGPDVQARLFATRFLALTEARRARAREAELEAALRDLLVGAWDPDENELEFYERMAEEFRRDTGFLRPGKDEAANGFGHSEKERRAAWDKWVVDRARARVTKIRAVLEGK